MRPRTFVLAAAAIGIAASVAAAQDDTQPRRTAPRDGEGRARMLQQFDTDGDGQISNEERAAAREQRQADRPGRGMRRDDGPRDGQGPRGDGLRDGQGPRGDGFGPLRDGTGPGSIVALMRFDTDNDGKLSDEELAALRTEYETRHQQLVKEHDADGDGQLSPEERREAFGPRRRPAAAPEGPAGDAERPREQRQRRPERPAD